MTNSAKLKKIRTIVISNRDCEDMSVNEYCEHLKSKEAELLDDDKQYIIKAKMPIYPREQVELSSYRLETILEMNRRIKSNKKRTLTLRENKEKSLQHEILELEKRLKRNKKEI